MIITGPTSVLTTWDWLPLQLEVLFQEIAVDLLEALDKGEGVVKDRIILSGVGGTAFRQSSVEDQDLQASR